MHPSSGSSDWPNRCGRRAAQRPLLAARRHRRRRGIRTPAHRSRALPRKGRDYANPRPGATQWRPAADRRRRRCCPHARPLGMAKISSGRHITTRLFLPSSSPHCPPLPGGGCESHSPACCTSTGPRRRRPSSDGRGARLTHPLTSAWTTAATASRHIRGVVCVEVPRSDLRPGDQQLRDFPQPARTLRPTDAVRRTAQRPPHRVGPRAGGAASADVPQSDGSAPTVKESARRPRSDSVVRYDRRL